ncbi:hypothetical protein [Rhizobium paknamense]|uniref:Uncharacterized protein n=1 Tax=Rhizobium paknamense TaxID=1206817 RepID=A0ABU0I912_9HYPH|nr:hypothetical protein [Rhizobium paknamense]MDQ0454727.1 hypothetical protein [Rhizobium paknamense]
MSKITGVSLNNGNIVFVGAVPAVPPSSKTTGNLTINNPGSSGVDAHFKATFMVTVDMEADGIPFTNIFHWEDVVLSETDAVPYREIESIAARNLAPALRAAADQIEAAVQEYESRNG